MTKDDVAALGIKAQETRDFFYALGLENTATDPEARLKQTERFERARADYHEALNAHQRALNAL